VIRIWDSINNSTDKLISLDMILMDEQVIFNNFNIGFAKLIYAWIEWYNSCYYLEGSHKYLQTTDK